MAPNETEPTREKIISLLKINGRMTTSELAETLGITQISIRHHLRSLEKDGLVEGREVRHGVGRPKVIYHLTDAALERNPAKYLQLTNLLLEQMKENLPVETVNRLFDEIASTMTEDLRTELKDLPLDKRLARLADWLCQEGFTAKVESAGPGQYFLSELACPYAKISIHHPEMCRMDASLISHALGADVVRKTCIHNGSESCTFRIQASPQEPLP